jgi:hypothetical protein
MKKRCFSASGRPGILPLSALAMAALFCALPGRGQQQPGLSPPPQKESKHAKSKHAEEEKPVLQPALSIPVTPLGFAPPALFYLGDRLAQVSLNFLDEDNLLFTFRIPGLIPREHPEPGQAAPYEEAQERNIRALVLSLPSGKVTAETIWRLHGFEPYLWVLKDHRFLLRDRNLLQFGDAALHLEPFLRFPGPVKYIEMDPEQQLLVAETVEPPATEPGPAGNSQGKFDSKSNVGSQSETTSTGTASVMPGGGADSANAAAQNQATQNQAVQNQAAQNQAAQNQAVQNQAAQNQGLLRIMRMDDRKVMLFTHIEDHVVHLPVDGDGYYEAARGKGLNWLISYRDFSGSANPLLQIDSTCYPSLDVLAPGLVLASACADLGARKLTALTRDKRRLWDVPISSTRVWPILVRATDAPRLARATLELNHPIASNSPLDRDDIRGQTVQIFDLATGKVVLTGPASPVLDGGGGFALSPSGKRFAVLNEGAIQIYDLPPVPALPPAAAVLSQSDPSHR